MIKLTELLKEQGEYGGKGPFQLPDNHIAGIRVPKGGSMCANCKFLSPDKKRCTEDNWIRWNGGDDIIPAPIDSYCSDFYEPDPKFIKENICQKIF